MLRDAIVATGALLYRLAPERHSLASVFDARRRPRRRRRVSDADRAEIFDLGYQGYDGERTSRWRRRRAIWRDGVRISLGLGRGTGAKVAPWLLIAPGARADGGARRARRVPRLGRRPTPTTSSCPRMPSTTSSRSSRSALFAAVVAPLLVCPDRRDGVLSLYAARPITPTDYVASRWSAFFTVAAIVACIPEAVLFVWNLLDAQRHRRVAPGQLGRRAALPRVRPGHRRRAHDAGAVRRVVHDPARVRGDRDGRRALHRRRGRRHRPRQLRRHARGRALRWPTSCSAVVDTVHWIFGEEIDDPRTRPAGSRRSGWRA